MWLSRVNHIHGIHEHDSAIYPKCARGPLNEEGCSKQWLMPDSTAELMSKLMAEYAANPAALRDSISGTS
ncbi:hypothetical protein HHUSO_G7122 [Huso huso]|uniref:Uncharacterized protein n=1 Tax=Huso huso TaxID=61971 RepID=A0ABR0ZZ86_HUSHU